MIDDWLLSLLYTAWLTASTMPLGFMLGSSCSPCCGGCGVADGKPRTDPNVAWCRWRDVDVYRQSWRQERRDVVFLWLAKHKPSRRRRNS